MKLWRCLKCFFYAETYEIIEIYFLFFNYAENSSEKSVSSVMVIVLSQVAAYIFAIGFSE